MLTLRIDGKIVIHRMCHVDISQQLRAWKMELADGWRADVWMKYRYCYNVSEEARLQSLRGVARALSVRGIKTARGGEWSAVQVA